MNSGTVTRPARWKLIVTACGLALLAGCASSSTSAAGTAALGKVKTAAHDLLTAAGTGCPSASPSASG